MINKEKDIKISIVTPSFNQGQYLEKTIRSVLEQGYPNLEYIIIDGGSRDNSVEIIRKYEEHLAYWTSESDNGQAHAINKGLEKATGELLGWLNSDDFFLPGALSRLARAYQDEPSVGVVYGQGHIVNRKGEIIYTPELKPITRTGLFNWCYGNNFMQPSSLFSRKAWDECGPLDEDFHYAMDLDFWIRVVDKFPFRQIDEPLSMSLSHPEAKTTSLKSRMYADFVKVYMKHGDYRAAKRVLDDITDRWARREIQITSIRKFYSFFGPVGRFLKFMFLKTTKT